MKFKFQLISVALALLLHKFSLSSAASVAGHDNQPVQFAQIDLQEYGIVELAHLVYKAEPDVVEEALMAVLEDDKESAVSALRSLQEPIDKFVSGVCDVCQTLVGSLKVAATSPEIFDRVTEGLILACENITERLGIRGDILCKGTLGLQMPHVYQVLRPSARNEAKEICEFLNLCFPATASDDANTQGLPPSTWYEPKQRKIAEEARSSRGKTPPENSITVVQVTDIHLEPDYRAGTNTDCGLPVCCVPDYGPGFAGKYGDYKCNLPRVTAEMFMLKANSFNPEVILFSGDVPPHSVWDETMESQKDCSKMLVDVINGSLPAGSRVYPNIGNHEGYPTNLFSTKNSLMGPFTNDYLEFWSDLWQPLADFTPEEVETVIRGGFYSKIVSEKLRLISFNTNYMYTFNWYNIENHRGANAEFAVMTKFVQEELEKAKVNDERVILMGHHPPGGQDYVIKGSRWYREIVLLYSDIIVLQPTGHTHYDEFRMIYDNNGTAKSTVLVAPSMTANGARNPSMRVFYLDKDSKQLLDYDHYFFDIGPVLRGEQVPDNWDDLITLLYSAKSEYGMEDLNPESWDDLLNRFEEDRDLLNKHRMHSQAGGNDPTNICLAVCQARHICRQKNVNYDEYHNCVVSGIDMEGLSTFTLPPRPTNPTPDSGNAASFIVKSSFTSYVFVFVVFAFILLIKA